MERRIKEKLKSLALEVVESVKGEITSESAGGLAFNFEKRLKNVKEIIIRFQWALCKCKFELLGILENGESKIEQYENGQYENESIVKRQLENVNRLYKNKLKREGKREGLINFYSKGFKVEHK